MEDCLIKSKPPISKKKMGFREGIGLYYLYGNGSKRRVDGGYEYWSTLTNDWEFQPDEEVVVKNAGTVSLEYMNISSLTQISKWYTELELKTIKNLKLAHNSLKSIDGIENFPSLKKIDLSFNLIEDLNILQSAELKRIGKINLSSNPIEQLIINSKSILPSNIVCDSIVPPCSECKCIRTKDIAKKYGSMCMDCHQKFIDSAADMLSLRPKTSDIEHIFRMFSEIGLKGTLIIFAIIYFLYLSQC
jgi:hypothetical protein